MGPFAGTLATKPVSRQHDPLRHTALIEPLRSAMIASALPGSPAYMDADAASTHDRTPTDLRRHGNHLSVTEH